MAWAWVNGDGIKHVHTHAYNVILICIYDQLHITYGTGRWISPGWDLGVDCVSVLGYIFYLSDCRSMQKLDHHIIVY